MLAFKSLIPVRLGALLTQANLIKPESLAQALQHARSSGDQLGQVLIINGCLDPDDLNCAIEIQESIRAGSFTADLGVKALKSFHESRTPVLTTLQELGWRGGQTVKISPLARLLLDANYIDKSQLQQASWACADNGLPLGRNLVLSGAVTPSVLSSALTLLVLLRNLQGSAHEPAQILCRSSAQHLTIEEVLGNCISPDAGDLKLAELLSFAGIVAESDITDALEISLDEQRNIIEVVRELNIVSAATMQSATTLHSLVEAEELTRVQAVEILRQAYLQGVPVSCFLEEMTKLKEHVFHLLVAAEVVTDKQVRTAHDAYPELGSIRALLASGYINKEVFRGALRILFLIDDGTYTRKQGIDVLNSQFAPILDPSKHNYRDQDQTGGLLQTA